MSPTDPDNESYAEHIVEIDSDGRILSCRQDLNDLLEKIAHQSRKRIVVYVHGGRVTLETSRRKALELARAIKKSDPHAYPIFLNWEAGQGTSYFRHVAYERNGVSYRETRTAPIAAVASPVVFFEDLARGAGRLPINTILSVGKVLQTSDTLVGRHDRFFPIKGKFDDRLRELNKKKDVADTYRNGFVHAGALGDQIPINISMGSDPESGKISFAAGYIATLPLQFITEPVLDTFGTPSWGNMVRRTRSMFHLQQNYISQYRQHVGAENSAKPGAGVFFEALDKFMQGHAGDHFTLEIYAHSMGSMIVNEAFAERPQLHVDQLVYMAAACSIRDFRNTAGVYIEKHGIPFYNLSLHPRAEVDEVELSGIPVRGSLLIWIDEFFNQPSAFGDRTLGTFENAVIAEDLLPHAPNVHLKAFGIEGARKKNQELFVGPQKHKEFAKYCFWQREFYDTSPPERRYRRIGNDKAGL